MYGLFWVTYWQNVVHRLNEYEKPNTTLTAKVSLTYTYTLSNYIPTNAHTYYSDVVAVDWVFPPHALPPNAKYAKILQQQQQEP